MPRNTRTNSADPAVASVATEDASTVVVDNDRSGLDIDHDGVVNAIVEAFQPLGVQISRLEVANEQFKKAGYAYTTRDGEVLDIRQLNSAKATLGIMCRMAISMAEGSRRYPDGTKALLDQAEFRFDRMADSDPNHPSLDRLAAYKRVAHHAHFNIALPLAEAMRSVYETLIGEPLDTEERPAKDAKAERAPKIDF